MTRTDGRPAVLPLALIAAAQAVAALLLQLGLTTGLWQLWVSNAYEIVPPLWASLWIVPGGCWIVALVIIAVVRRRVLTTGTLALVALIFLVAVPIAYWVQVAIAAGPEGIGMDALWPLMAAIFGVLLIPAAAIVGVLTGVLSRRK